MLFTHIRHHLHQLRTLSRKHKLSPYLFLCLCLNLVIAPAIQASNQVSNADALSRSQAYALGILILATVALSVYLFVSMFQPERF